MVVLHSQWEFEGLINIETREDRIQKDKKDQVLVQNDRSLEISRVPERLSKS